MKLFIAFAILLLPVFVLLYVGITAHNEEAKEKGSTEKGYTVWSVLGGLFALLFGVFFEVFSNRWNKYKDWRK